MNEDLATGLTLKACPWCGEGPDVEPWHGGGPNKHMVSCANELCPASPAVTAETRNEAIRLWNERQPDEQEAQS